MNFVPLAKRVAPAVLLLVAAPWAMAQQQQQQQRTSNQQPSQRTSNDQQQRDMVDTSVALPGSNQVLEITVRSPSEVRVGESYSYEVNVTNTSDQVVLHDVVLEQKASEGFHIEQANLMNPNRSSEQQQGRAQNGNAQRQGQQQANSQGEGSSDNQNNQNSDSNSNNQNDQDSDSRSQRATSQQQDDSQQEDQEDSEQDDSARDDQSSEQSNQASQQRSQASQQGGQSSQQSGQASQQGQDKNRWTIDKLEPGETRRIEVTASSDQEGASGACIAVVSFSPAVCLRTEFVKPELELVKTAPDEATLCEPLEYSYYIKNGGSGDTGPLTIRDELDEGLQTVTGEKQLEFTVDNLRPGDTRKFVAELQATEAKEYASRATVESERGEQARSNRDTTRIVQAELAVEIDGSDVTYLDRPVTYTARVTNHGNAPAPSARLTIAADRELRVVQMGDLRESSQAVEASGQSTGQPTVAQGSSDSQQQANSQQQQGSSQQQQANSQQQQQQQQQAGTELQSWDLGRLEPGQTREVRYTVRAAEAGTIRQEARAQYVCFPEQDQQQVVRSVASTQTEVIALPALLVAVVDEEDPIEVGGEVVYKIVVENQGNAADKNIQLKAKLPEGMEFVKVDGETNAKAEGSNVTFQPVEQLDAGQRVAWTMRAKLKEEGTSVVEVQLTSDSQDEEVRSEESTRSFNGEEE